MNKTTYLWEFIKVFDEWNKIEEFCYDVTNTRAQLVDLNGKIIIGSKNLSNFCKYVSKSAVGSIRCHECYQKNAFSSEALTNGYSIFKCHVGLTNFCVPVTLDKEIIGAIIGGGVLVNESDLRNSDAHIKEMKLDRDIFSNKMKQVKVISENNIESASRILKSISSEFAEIFTPYYKQLEIMNKLSSEYQENNIFSKDELTGLLCQNFFNHRLKEELDIAHRYSTHFCLIMLSIDNFREINQKYGHAFGDTVIKTFTDTVKSNLRKVDTLYRYSGNVFSILATFTQTNQAVKFTNRLTKAIEKYQHIINLKDSDLLTFSAGITPYDNHSATLTSMVQNTLNTLEKAINTKFGTIKIYELPYKKDNKRRVVATGIGIVSPIGIGKEAFMKSLIEGKSGTGLITSFDATGLTSRVAAEVKDFDPLKYMTKKLIDRSGRSSQLAVAAAKMAVEDANLDKLKGYDEKRISVVVGSAMAGLEYGEEQFETFIRQGIRRVSPYLSVIVFAGIVSSEISIELGVKGRSSTISTGCTAGADAIGYAFHEIRSGESDMVITGGVEAPIRPVVLASFCNLKALSTHNEDPARASRPFDKTRSGFVIGEGAGIIVLEELQHALSRGAHIYGEVLGYGATDDAFHLTQPAPNGESAARAIKNAMESAGIAPEDVDYINAHGSSTPLNDCTETRILKNVFGKYANKIPVSSTKSLQGHPLGASGALEFIASVLGMQHSFLPPTINYEVPDPECDLEDYVTTGSRKKEINVIVSNNFGFGGKNASLVIRKY